ncbi:MAG: hypothetical protein COB36_04205 [Alphaproteobacteria bacterium]|nr:MAG: hypothetical protein COB36_04205 [Alphaproteobacteria bacterium]
MGSSVTVGNLRLLKFNTRYLSDEVRSWQEKSGVPFAESCDNQIWYGKKTDFDDFPFPKGRGDEVKVMDDEDAYKFLLDTVSGFRSKRKGETHIRRQFTDGLHVLRNEHPEKEKHYQNLVSKIKKDVAYIQNSVSVGHKNTNNIMIARDLSGQVKGETVLIIGSLGGGGFIGDNTKKIIGLSENKQDPNGKMLGRDHFIRITHPDPLALESLKSQVEAIKEKGIFRSNIDFVDFADINVHFEECDRVYIDLPMKPDDVMDEIMAISWMDRVRQDNTLVHMRGNPLTRMQSTDTWKQGGLTDSGFIAPEDLIAECAQRSQDNALILQRVDNASRTLAALRLDGIEHPAKAIEDQGISLDPEDLSQS